MNLRQFILIAFLLAGACNGYSQTAGEWQSDLQYLKQIVHSDYSNLFYNISAADWDKAADELYSQIPSMDKYQMLTGFVKLVALFQIGHTRINTRQLLQAAGDLQLTSFPYQLYKFNDGVYILKADKKYEQAVGGKVIRKGKRSTDEAIEAIRPLVYCENEYGFDRNSMSFLSIPEFLKTQGITDNSDEIEISYLKDGNEETVVFIAAPGNINSMTGLETPPDWSEARKPGDTPLWQKDPTSYRYMEYLQETKTLYVRHSVVLDDSTQTIESFFGNVFDFINKNDVQKFVLDVRMNDGGNNYLNKPVITGIIRSEKINKNGNFYCIIGRRTFSAAQNLVNELEKYTEVIFVGEPTGENVNFYGDTKTEILPNSKLQARLSWLWWQNLDPRDKRKATYPILAVDMSFDDYYNNVDPAMNVINTNFGGALTDDNLKELVEQEKFDEAVIMAKEFMQDPLHRYHIDEIEVKINSLGYSLLGQNKFEVASKVLFMNVQLFPESANVYDSYAESLWKLGNTEEALKYYEIAITKDKSGATAENSKKMIEEIKKSLTTR